MSDRRHATFRYRSNGARRAHRRPHISPDFALAQSNGAIVLGGSGQRQGAVNAPAPIAVLRLRTVHARAQDLQISLQLTCA
jgi:hypothetical protein